MATSLKRYSVCVPDEILKILQEDCWENQMPIGRKISLILLDYYRTEKAAAAGIIDRSQRHAKKSERQAVPIFGDSLPPESEDVSIPQTSNG